VGAALLIFDPEIDLKALRGKSPTQGRSDWFAAGEMSRMVREALRVAGEPLSAATIVRQIMVAKAMDLEDKRLRLELRQTPGTAPNGQAREHSKSGEPMGARWTASEEA
jgi:hypothetical protein